MDENWPGSMDGQAKIPREIVESPSYAEQKSRAVAAPRRLDDLLEGVLFAIARIPEDFPGIGGYRSLGMSGP